MRNYSEPPKKRLILNILDILQKYTDENHTLSQKDILDILSDEYSMSADRKSVARNINDLIELGFDITYTIIKRESKSIDKKTGEMIVRHNNIRTDYCLIRDFTDSELRLLVDSILFSKHIDSSQCKQLVEKLENLSSIYFKTKIKHITKLDYTGCKNKQLFSTIDLIDEAITNCKKISFHYLEYHTDKKLHERKNKDGDIREYIVSPYQMAVKEGKYYLICNYDKYDDISNYRIDRIKDIKVLSDSAKPFYKLDGAQSYKLDLATYMKEHVYMFSSKSIRAVFRIDKCIISDVIDMFTSDVKFYDETDKFVTVSTYTNEMSLIQFAKTFSPFVKILSPSDAVQKIKEDLLISIQNYNE